MSDTTSSQRWRWAVPAGAAALVAAAVVVPRIDPADAADALPEKTAAELLADVSQAEVDGLSGTVVQTSRLGFPELPDDVGGGRGGVDLTTMLSGSNLARVWYAGDERQRVELRVGEFASYEVVRDGTDLWTYDSFEDEVTHVALAEYVGEEPGVVEEELPPGVTPESAAERVLGMVDGTTEVSVGRAETVAGRAAYELVLEPRDELSLVESVRVAVDGETSVPLRVQWYGEGQVEPAFEVGFTSVSFEVPDEQVFAFTPPATAEVEEKDLSAVHRDSGDHDMPMLPEGAPAPDADGVPAGAAPQVTGSGWTTVVTLPGVTLPDEAGGLLAGLSQPVEGGRAVRSALLSALLLDDGRVLVGSVPVEELQRTAALPSAELPQ